MPEFFWTLLKIGGYTIIALFSLGVTLIVATLALCVVWLVSDARKDAEYAGYLDAMMRHVKNMQKVSES